MKNNQNPPQSRLFRKIHIFAAIAAVVFLAYQNAYGQTIEVFQASEGFGDLQGSHRWSYAGVLFKGAKDLYKNGRQAIYSSSDGVWRADVGASAEISRNGQSKSESNAASSLLFSFIQYSNVLIEI